MKTFVLLAALTIGTVPAMVGQTAGGSAKDSVTTNDSVFNPNDTKSAKTNDKAANGKLPKDKSAKGDTKNDTKPVSPPNPPVVDPHGDTGSPVNGK
jgi:hypothetical protein